MKFLAVLKPDGVIRKAAGAGILKGLSESKYCTLDSFIEVKVPETLLAIHYNHVSQKNFYPWLVRYMSSFPSYVIFLEAKNETIYNIRHLLGATRAQEAESTSLRYNFCPYGGANGLHLSEDEKAGEYEVGLWKRILKISEGRFDIPIDEYIESNISSPNHTFELRRIFTQIANGISTLKDEEEIIKKLLQDESGNATAEQIEFLYWVYTDPLK